MAINFLVALSLLSGYWKSGAVAAAALGSLAVIVLAWVFNPDDVTQRLQFQGQELLFHKDTRTETSP